MRGNETPAPNDAICARCRYRSTCKAPCAPVEAILSAGGNAKVKEIRQGGLVIVFPKGGREIHETVIRDLFGEDGQNAADLLFSTEARSAFRSELTGDGCSQKTTALFIDRFFGGMSYEGLSTKYGIEIGCVGSMLSNAKKRIFEVIAFLDKGKAICAHVEPKFKIKKSTQAFLLQHLFGLRPVDIGKVMGIGTNTVTMHLQQALLEIQAGETDLLTVTADERAAAKKQLATVRRKKREGYHLKKAMTAECAASM